MAIPNPQDTFPVTDADAPAEKDETQDGTPVDELMNGVDVNELLGLLRGIMAALGGDSADDYNGGGFGAVIVHADELKFSVCRLNYLNSGTPVLYAGAADQTLTDDATNCIYLDAAGALANAAAYPGTERIRLATVVCASAAVVSVTDDRPMISI
jgi:hypothetical protein